MNSNNEYLILSPFYTDYNENSTEYLPFMSEASIVCVNEIGDILWNKTYGNNICSPISICELDDGYLLSGNTYHPEHPYGQIYLEKIDWLGDSVWNRSVGNYGWRMNDIISCTNGELLLVGNHLMNLERLYMSYGWLLSVSNAGVEKWSRHLNSSHFPDFEDITPEDLLYPRGLTELSNGLFAIGGNYPYHGWLAFFEANGTIVNARSFSSSSISEIFELDQSTVMTIGYGLDLGSNSQIIQYVSTDCNLEKSFKYKYHFIHNVKAVRMNNDGGATSLMSDHISDSRLFNTNETGHISWHFWASTRHACDFVFCDDGSIILLQYSPINDIHDIVHLWKYTFEIPSTITDFLPESLAAVVYWVVILVSPPLFIILIVVLRRRSSNG